MPPLVLAALGALGATLVVRFLRRESGRVNDIIDPHRGPEPVEATGQPLEKDPKTGAYRPRQQR